MKQLHNAAVSVFVKENEEEEKIAQKLCSLIPLDLEKEKISVKRERVTGARENLILILSVALNKERHTNAFLKWLLAELTREQKQLLSTQAATRLDADCNFFIRFNKAQWVEKGKLQITDGGDCFHMKMDLAAYPANVERGLNMIKELLS